ncbi:MAG: thioredoxin [Hydrocarboniphaga sp.]|uniref:TlpA family protein disulfide reductase n=1 Tax=Hydrocarboniphaga sp. TaxID=2033016 RepID=UPI002601F57D|nr:TlpA disulfide reductase family protein [Hydrocarboniphaga sp.]MDB5969798.1 thioredoxin [Hydrocarboniphaga sp.]
MRNSAIQGLTIIGLCVVAAIGGFAVYRYLAQPSVIDQTACLAPEITLNDLNAQPRKLSEWRGKLVLVNFWATWCAPCLHEIPMLLEIQQQYGARGLQIVGPAMDDMEAVKTSAPELGINYPVLVGDTEIVTAMQALGDTLGALPYSVLIDANGTIVYRKHGEFDRDALQKLIEQHLPAG